MNGMMPPSQPMLPMDPAMVARMRAMLAGRGQFLAPQMDGMGGGGGEDYSPSYDEAQDAARSEYEVVPDWLRNEATMATIPYADWMQGGITRYADPAAVPSPTPVPFPPWPAPPPSWFTAVPAPAPAPTPSAVEPVGMPSGSGGTAADGQTFAGQPPNVQEAFVATYGPTVAPGMWALQHNAEIGKAPPMFRAPGAPSTSLPGTPPTPLAGTPPTPAGTPVPPAALPTPVPPIAAPSGEYVNVAMRQAEIQAAQTAAQSAYWQWLARSGDERLAFEKAQQAAQESLQHSQLKLQQEQFGFQREQAGTQNALQAAGLLAQLRGPANAFAQMRALYGLNAAGQSNILDALKGTMGAVPTFQAPQAGPQAMSLQTLQRDLAGAGTGPNAGGTFSPEDFVQGLPAVNKLVGRSFLDLTPDAQAFTLAGYEARGESPNDVLAGLKAGLPQFRAPLVGSIGR